MEEQLNRKKPKSPTWMQRLDPIKNRWGGVAMQKSDVGSSPVISAPDLTQLIPVTCSADGCKNHQGISTSFPSP